MEWFVFAAPIPGPVEFTVGGSAAFTVLLAIALLRSDAALEYLRSLLPDRDAAKALEIYEDKS